MLVRAVMVIASLLVFSASIITVLADTYLVGGDYTWKDPTWTDPPFDYQAWTDSIIFSPGDALGQYVVLIN